MTERPLVRMTGIGKRFGGAHACRDIDLTVRAGEVHALLGENGAGKSTLINILSGVITEYDGAIELEGRPVRFAGPSDAQRAGIATIHQELDLVAGLSIAENMFLGREPRTRVGTVDIRRMRRQATEHLRALGADLEPRRLVGSLRVGEQQLVEIGRALSLDARVLIMDEPTAALADAEVERLFATIAELRRAGVGIVYISHRMAEIEVVADRVTVLRNGSVAGSVDPKTASRDDIIQLMVGRSVDALFGEGRNEPGDVLLDVRRLAVTPRRPTPGRTEPAGVDLSVRAGEIVGLAGLMGAGRTELLETLFGAGGSGRRAGQVTIDGRPYRPHGPRSALARGVAFVPEDRRAAGLMLEHSVTDNVVLSALSTLTTLGLVRRQAVKRTVAGQLSALAVKAASPAVATATLSGGNQQKVVFAKQLLTRPRLLLLDEPTRGVDIGAKAEIYRLLHQLADTGMAILLASSELPELLSLCDRVVVLHRGRTVAALPRASATQQAILAAANGDDAKEAR